MPTVIGGQEGWVFKKCEGVMISQTWKLGKLYFADSVLLTLYADLECNGAKPMYWSTHTRK